MNRMSLNLGLSVVSSWLDSGYVFLASNITDVSVLLIASLFIFMLKIPQIWPVVRLAPVAIILWVRPYFLAQDVLSSSYTFSAPALQSAISPRDLCFF